MRIGIDATPLSIPFPCGTKHYAKGLIHNLAKIDNKNEYLLYSKKDFIPPEKHNFRKILISKNIPLFKRQYFMTHFAKRDGVDVFHFLEPFGSLFKNKLKIVTSVHDFDLAKINPKISNVGQIIHRVYAETVRYFNLINSSYFICVSNSTRKELTKNLKRFSIKTKSATVHNGYDHRFTKFKKAHTKKNIILSMGDYSPRKNIPRVIKAYKKLEDKLKDKFKLVIVISTKKPIAEYSQLTKILNLDNNVEFELSPDRDKLIKLYNSSIVFVFPSLYEGFGIPILEAFACGCPVITSNYGATKEAAGNSAILVNPMSVEQITKAIIKVAQNNNIRSKLSNNGLVRAKKFSWEKSAHETLKIYQKVFQM
jgi:glycosyltransferase involved in cell wall biosynthesis